MSGRNRRPPAGDHEALPDPGSIQLAATDARALLRAVPGLTDEEVSDLLARIRKASDDARTNADVVRAIVSTLIENVPLAREAAKVAGGLL